MGLTETDLTFTNQTFPATGPPTGHSAPFAHRIQCVFCVHASDVFDQPCPVRVSRSPQVWSLKLEQEVEKNKALAAALQTLASEHQQLQQSPRRSGGSSALSVLNQDDFFDALSGQHLLTERLGMRWVV